VEKSNNGNAAWPIRSQTADGSDNEELLKYNLDSFITIEIESQALLWG